MMLTTELVLDEHFLIKVVNFFEVNMFWELITQCRDNITMSLDEHTLTFSTTSSYPHAMNVLLCYLTATKVTHKNCNKMVQRHYPEVMNIDARN